MPEGSSALLSVVGFIIAIGAIAVGTAAGLVAVPIVGSFLGMLAGAFVAGFAVEDRPVVESGLAAVLVNLGVLAWGGFIGGGIVAGLSALASIGTLPLLVSIALSFAVAAFGAHFGDDLRDGLTEPVDSPPSRSLSDSVVAPAGDESDEEAQTSEPDEEGSAWESSTEQTSVDDRTTEAKPDHSTDGRTDGETSDEAAETDGETSDEAAETDGETSDEAADLELEYE